MQVSGKFQKGQSGNPSGKARGTKNNATLAAEYLLKGELGNICRKLVEEAVKGNLQAIKLVLDRVLPSRRDPVIDIKLPTMQTIEDAAKGMSAILEAISSGKITPSEGEALSRVIDAFLKVLQMHEIEKRVSMLEEEVKR